MSRVDAAATAFPSRTAPYDLVVIAAWTDSAEDASNIAWARKFHSGMEPWSAHLVYVNALDQDDADRIPEAYGVNYERLCEVKKRYDPENRFRRNQNIATRMESELAR